MEIGKQAATFRRCFDTIGQPVQECTPPVKRCKVQVQHGFLPGLAAWGTSMKSLPNDYSETWLMMCLLLCRSIHFQ